MRIKLVLLFFLAIVLSCSQSKSKPITELSQNDINSGILVDVRTEEEFGAGHIDNALNINWYATDFTKQFESIAKDETIYLYCKKGGRSAKAAALLDSLGYNDVTNLLGGYDAYHQKNK